MLTATRPDTPPAPAPAPDDAEATQPAPAAADATQPTLPDSTAETTQPDPAAATAEATEDAADGQDPAGDPDATQRLEPVGNASNKAGPPSRPAPTTTRASPADPAAQPTPGLQWPGLPTTTAGLVGTGGVMEQRSAVMVAAKRTPMGRFLGAFADVPAVDLGIAAARAALDAAGLDPGEVEETVAGHGRQAGNGPNPGRQVSVRTGIPETVPAYTVNKACGSSAKALTLAAGSVLLEELDVALVVGMENMTRTRTCCGACAAATGWARRWSRTPCPPTASSTPWPARPWARRPRTWPSATP